MRAVIYLRVSTGEQAVSGLGLAAQEAACRAECDRRGWEIVVVVADEGVSASVPFVERPAGVEALGLLCSPAGKRHKRGADVLVAARLDRLARSVPESLGLFESAQRCGFAVVPLGSEVDTSTATGEFQLTILAAAARFEKRLIGERTSAALQAKKAQGFRLGRPVTMNPAIRSRVVELRGEGLSYRAIAETLRSEGLAATAEGKAWPASRVQRVLESVALDRLGG